MELGQNNNYTQYVQGTLPFKSVYEAPLGEGFFPPNYWGDFFYSVDFGFSLTQTSRPMS